MVGKRAVLLLLSVFAAMSLGVSPGAQDRGTDIDALMEEVLQQREVNWEALRNYVFSELEVLEVRGSLEVPALQGFRREYVWYVKDDYLVRKLVSVDGVVLPEEGPGSHEERWKGERSGITIGRDIFFKFKFERGNYYFVGRGEFEGRQVLEVEYYPEKLFNDGEEEEDDDDEEYSRMFDKTSLVTMLVEPNDKQLVKFTFDNIGLDFLPGKWAVRVGGFGASLVMGKPFEEVWLPKRVEAEAELVTAYGDFAVRYSREFYDYKKTAVSVKFGFEIEKPRPESR